MIKKVIFYLFLIISFLQVSVFACQNCQNNKLYKNIIYVPSGLKTTAILAQNINSKTILKGQVIEAILLDDLKYNDNVIATKESIIKGTVIVNKQVSKTNKEALIQIRFTSIVTPYNNSIPVSAVMITNNPEGIIKGDSNTKGEILLSAEDTINLYFNQPITLSAQ